MVKCGFRIRIPGDPGSFDPHHHSIHPSTGLSGLTFHYSQNKASKIKPVINLISLILGSGRDLLIHQSEKASTTTSGFPSSTHHAYLSSIIHPIHIHIKIGDLPLFQGGDLSLSGSHLLRIPSPSLSLPLPTYIHKTF